jgi:prephenate dehydrogenase
LEGEPRLLGSEAGRVAIIGLGLIGGSLGLALKKANGPETEVVGFSRRSETVARAKERGIIDSAAADMASAVRDADMVAIATPVLAIEEILQGVSAHLRAGCTVTDMGSTKREVMRWADEYLPAMVSFVGGHPMAGKETSGLDEADADLFRGCTYCLVPAPNAGRDQVDLLGGLVKSIGARPLYIDAETHDSLVAGVSHLPILLSAAFVTATTDSPEWGDMAKLAAGGYRDMSRLASGEPQMHRDICVTNRDEILRWIDTYIEELSGYRRLVAEAGDGLMDALSEARSAREKWLREGKQ